MDVKNRIINLIGIVISIFILTYLIWLGLWNFNILKKESPMPQDLQNIQAEAEYLIGLDFRKLAEDLKQILPQPQLIEIPVINPQEIGKSYLFE